MMMTVALPGKRLGRMRCGWKKERAGGERGKKERKRWGKKERAGTEVKADGNKHKEREKESNSLLKQKCFV